MSEKYKLKRDYKNAPAGALGSFLPQEANRFIYHRWTKGIYGIAYPLR
jgi:hypothetical protein